MKKSKTRKKKVVDDGDKGGWMKPAIYPTLANVVRATIKRHMHTLLNITIS